MRLLNFWKIIHFLIQMTFWTCEFSKILLFQKISTIYWKFTETTWNFFISHLKMSWNLSRLFIDKWATIYIWVIKMKILKNCEPSTIFQLIFFRWVWAKFKSPNFIFMKPWNFFEPNFGQEDLYRGTGRREVIMRNFKISMIFRLLLLFFLLFEGSLSLIETFLLLI